MISGAGVSIQASHPNKPPFSFVDKIYEYYPDQYIRGCKFLSQNDWFFAAHWPGHPVMPGSLQLEAITQLGGLLLFLTIAKDEAFVALRGISNANFYKEVVPGDIFEIENTVIRSTRGIVDFEGTARVSGEKVCSAKFTLVCPTILKAFYGS